MEGVAETIASPGILAEVVAESAENADTIAGEEWKRSGSSAGDDGAVDGTLERRATPGGVAVFPVGGADTPVVVVVAAIEAEAEGLVGAGCGDRVDEVVGEGVALAGEIEPGVGELVDEERISAADVRVWAEGHGGASEGAPCVGGDGMGG